MDNRHSFNEYDGLVLATIASNKTCDLTIWFGFIDAYYRVVLSYAELDRALCKLQKSGFILFDGGRFRCTQRAEKILAGRVRLSVFAWICKVQERLCKTPVECLYDVRFRITEAEYEKALAAHHARFR